MTAGRPPIPPTSSVLLLSLVLALTPAAGVADPFDREATPAAEWRDEERLEAYRRHLARRAFGWGPFGYFPCSDGTYDCLSGGNDDDEGGSSQTSPEGGTDTGDVSGQGSGGGQGSVSDF